MTRLNVFRIENENLTRPSMERYITNFDSGLREVHLNDPTHARLYLIENNPRVPDWVGYLKGLSTDAALDIVPARTIGALLAVQPDTAADMVYVFTWGNGHFRVNKNRINHTLGIRCVLNMMSDISSQAAPWDPARIKSVKTKRLGVNPLIIESQYARDSALEEFPVDTDSDQLKSITGRPMDAATWGKMISGSVSLHIKAPDDPAGLVDICNKISAVFTKTEYKNYFEWVDHIVPFFDQNIIDQLDAAVVNAIKAGNTGDLILTVPDLVNFEALDHFEYQTGQVSTRPAGEPDMDEIIDFLTVNHLQNTLTVDLLKNNVLVKAFDSNNVEVQSWSAYDCISGEVDHLGKPYLLDGGDYYTIQKNYLDELNTNIDEVPEFDDILVHPPKGTNENDYIDRRTNFPADALVLHKHLINRAGSTPIEICDILLPTGHLLHLKNGVNSSCLSHLFAQAAVGGELLLFDDEFKQEVETKVKEAVSEAGISGTPYQFLYDNFQSSRCTIVLGIITGKVKGKLSKILPFFSKITLRYYCKRYRSLGYKYKIAQIYRS